jgi:YVTN family beta-propeller protein
MSYFRITLVFLLITVPLGCVKNNKSGSLITDSGRYYHLSGFSVKPPSGNNWLKLPSRDEIPNSIDFRIIEIKSQKPEPNKSEGSITFVRAMSSILDEPVPSRTDTTVLASALRAHLNRYYLFSGFKVIQSEFDRGLGFDCLRFNGRFSKERILADWGDIRFSDVEGYFCLHPDQDNFGVLMFSVNGASAGSTPVIRDQEVNHSYRSLHFDPIPTIVSRSFVHSPHTIGKSPYEIALYKGMLWVALKDENRVVKIDPSDGKVVASIEVGNQPVSITSGQKGVWVANSGDATVSRIDPDINMVEAIIQVGGKVVSINAGRGGVWVADAAGGRIVRIDPTNNAVVATISVGREPVSVNSGNEGIWCANAGDGTVMVIDPDNDQVVSTIEVGGRPIRVSLGDTGAWIADEAGNQAVRIERKARKISARINLNEKPSWIFSSNYGEVFVVLPNAAEVVRIDPARNRIFGSAMKIEGTPHSVFFANGILWAANSKGYDVIRINLSPYGQLLSKLPSRKE